MCWIPPFGPWLCNMQFTFSFACPALRPDSVPLISSPKLVGNSGSFTIFMSGVVLSMFWTNTSLMARSYLAGNQGPNMPCTWVHPRFMPPQSLWSSIWTPVLLPPPSMLSLMIGLPWSLFQMTTLSQIMNGRGCLEILNINMLWMMMMMIILFLCRVTLMLPPIMILSVIGLPTSLPLPHCPSLLHLLHLCCLLPLLTMIYRFHHHLLQQFLLQLLLGLHPRVLSLTMSSLPLSIPSCTLMPFLLAWHPQSQV